MEEPHRTQVPPPAKSIPKRRSRSARAREGSANPQRVAALPADKYFSVNWVQCLLEYFRSQPPSVQRTMRSSISHCKLHDLTPFGVTVEQLTAALTLGSSVPESIRTENRGIDFNLLGF